MDSSSAQKAQTRREALNLWPIRSISLLLSIQSLGLLLYNVYQLRQINWQQEIYDIQLSVEAQRSLTIAAVFVPFSLFLLFVALGFFYRRPVAWLLAMMIQGLILLACLSFYFLQDENQWVYLIMLYSILMVLYINAKDVRQIFRRRRRKPYVRPITPPRYRGSSASNIQ